MAATFAHCNQRDVLPLIARGDAVRVVAMSGGDCPAGWGDRDFDDAAWASARLPIAAVPASGVCLRKRFDVGARLEDYRWLTVRLSSGSRARLNTGKAVTSDAERGGLDWTADGEAEVTARPIPVREYTLDLRLFPTLLQPSANVLALQVGQTREAVDLEANLRRDDTAAADFVRVIKGPYRLRPTPTTTRIAWESDRSAPSWLIVDGKQYDGGWGIHHEVEIGGLVGGRVYSYWVSAAEASALPPQCAALVGGRAPTSDRHIVDAQLTDDDFWRYIERRDACSRVAAAIHSDPRALRAPSLAAPVRIAILGDTRADEALPHDILDAIALQAPDLVVHTGDVVASGSEADWQAFFDGGAALLAGTPLAPVPGERDNAPWGDRFAQLFGGGSGRTYAVDLGSAHLAMLDSTGSLAEQAVWLERDLTAAEARGAVHLYVVMHAGPYSSASGGSAAARALIEPVARRHGVEAFFSGHDNLYEHGLVGGLHYFVSGGGGALLDRAKLSAATLLSRAVPHYLLLEVDGDHATLAARDAGGALFDLVTLR